MTAMPLSNATQEELEALAELGVWMQRNHLVAATGRACGDPHLGNDRQNYHHSLRNGAYIYADTMQVGRAAALGRGYQLLDDICMIFYKIAVALDRSITEF